MPVGEEPAIWMIIAATAAVVEAMFVRRKGRAVARDEEIASGSTGVYGEPMCAFLEQFRRARVFLGLAAPIGTLLV